MMDDKALKRFLAKSGPAQKGGCRDWLGCKGSSGSGGFWTGERTEEASRVAYEHWFGPIPEGYIVHHTCRHRGCVEPTHLQAVTRREHSFLDVAPKVTPRGNA